MKVYEILGIGFPNRGAELLLLATIDALKQPGQPFNFLCHPTWQDEQSPSKILSLGGKLRFGPSTSRLDLWRLAEWAPERARRAYGWGRESDVNMALDASGLAYCEKNGETIMEMRTKIFKRYKKRRIPIVMLPQAMGPFESQKVRKAARELFSYPDLIFPRDLDSAKNIRELGCKCEDPVPDITINFGEVLHSREQSKLIGIIPNYRMIDKGGLGESSYIDFLSEMARQLAANGCQIVWINHEGKMDIQLISKAYSKSGNIGDIFDPGDAMAIKNKIGECGAIFSSRYHGLVSSLSQGRPCIGTSWSHKYQQLVNDFGNSVKIISESKNSDAQNAATWLIAASQDNHRQVQLAENAIALRKKVTDMWLKVKSLTTS